MITWILAAVCMAVCLTRASVFEWIKTLIISSVPKGFDEVVGELMYCSQCLGFWIGAIGSAFFPLDLGISNSIALEALFTGFIVSTLSILMDRLIYGRNNSSASTDQD